MADHVILADIYAARETDTLGMTSEALAEELKQLGVDAYYFSSFEEIENFALKNCIHGDVLITMGAGDVVNIGDSLLKEKLSTLSTKLLSTKKARYPRKKTLSRRILML